MKININGRDWTIKECANNEVPLHDGFFFGRCFHFDKIIYLNQNLAQDQKRETLAHELTHAFISETQITGQEQDLKYTEEMLCEFVGMYGKSVNDIVEKYFIEVKDES